MERENPWVWSFKKKIARVNWQNRKFTTKFLFFYYNVCVLFCFNYYFFLVIEKKKTTNLQKWLTKWSKKMCNFSFYSIDLWLWIFRIRRKFLFFFSNFTKPLTINDFIVENNWNEFKNQNQKLLKNLKEEKKLSNENM